jgi:hypothetical protein
LAAVNLSRRAFHGEWNYTISPTRQNRNWLSYLWTSPYLVTGYIIAQQRREIRRLDPKK